LKEVEQQNKNGNFRPVSKPLEKNSSDKLKKVEQQNKNNKNTGLVTGIELPHDHDVVSGRGNYSTYHPGNHRFRKIICKIKEEYMKSSYSEKKRYAQDVVDKIKSLNPPGRFLKRDTTCATKSWYELGQKDTLAKTRQALREGSSNYPIEKKKKKAMTKKSILRRGGCLEEQVDGWVKNVNTIEQEAIPKNMMDGRETYKKQDFIERRKDHQQPQKYQQHQIKNVNTIEQEAIPKNMMDGRETYKKQDFVERRKDQQQPQKYQQHQIQSLTYQKQHQVHKVAMHFQAILPWPNEQPEQQQILIRNNFGQRQLQPKQKMNLGGNNGDTRSERSN
jgi:hypothetical protein